jgi:hypothetical protein
MFDKVKPITVSVVLDATASRIAVLPVPRTPCSECNVSAISIPSLT